MPVIFNSESFFLTYKAETALFFYRPPTIFPLQMISLIYAVLALSGEYLLILVLIRLACVFQRANVQHTRNIYSWHVTGCEQDF